jgi:hypothetical protein
MRHLLQTLRWPAVVALLLLGAVEGDVFLARAERQGAPPPVKQGSGKQDDAAQFPR